MSCTVVQINVTKIFVTGTRIAKEILKILWQSRELNRPLQNGVIDKIAP